MNYQSVIFHTKTSPKHSEIEQEITKTIGIKTFAEQYFHNFFEHNTFIGIEHINELIQWNSKKVEQGVKYAYIPNAENINQIAQNALLKVIEEPAPNTLIVMAAYNLDTLLDTVRSRCKVIAIDVEMVEEGIEVESIINNSYTARAIAFQSIVKQSRVEQRKFVEAVTQYMMQNGRGDLVKDLMKLQKAIGSQVQNNLVFDELNNLLS